MIETYVALLRGINVGGNNKLPMKDLAAIFSAAGATDVRTLIQSGNVIFTAKSALASSICQRVAAQIFDTFSIRVPIVLRRQAQLRSIIGENPYLRLGVSEDQLHVMFLADKPNANLVATLDSQRSPGDTFQVLGAEVFLHLPNGVGRSKLTNAYFDSRLKTVSTIRNWRTVSKLLAMMEE